MTPLFKVFMAANASSYVADVLQSGYIGEGEVADQFEQEFSEYVGADITLVNSATSGLELAAQMIGIQPGDEVITTAMTCSATHIGSLLYGATLVWADIDPRTGLIDPESVKKNITSKTKAIVAVNWGGRKPDYTTLKSFGFPVIEDAAHGPYVLDGNNGDYVVWSFQAIKFLTTGDGGALYSPDPDRARLLRWYGFDRRSSADFRCGSQLITELGRKLHMNNINAAIGLANLPHLHDIMLVHQANALLYDEVLGNVKRPPYDPTCAYWIYTIFSDRGIIPYLKERGIAASPVHERNDVHPAFRKNARNNDLPSVLEYNQKQINIPVGWWVTNVEEIATYVREYEGC